MTVGADKAHDTADFVATCKAFGVEAHVARNTSGRGSNIADAVAGSVPYRASQVHRKRIKEVFGWVKTVARLSKKFSRPARKAIRPPVLGVSGHFRAWSSFYSRPLKRVHPLLTHSP